MAQCEACGNDYDKAFEVTMAGERHVFDSFECAIHRLAPTCTHCGCRVVGHGNRSQRRHLLLCALRPPKRCRGCARPSRRVVTRLAR